MARMGCGAINPGESRRQHRGRRSVDGAETLFPEVTVEREGAVHAAASHDFEADAIDEAQASP